MRRRHGVQGPEGARPGDAVAISGIGASATSRKDLHEALEFARDGLVHTVFSEDRLDRINAIFGRMKAGDIEGRVVLRIGAGD